MHKSEGERGTVRHYLATPTLPPEVPDDLCGQAGAIPGRRRLARDSREPPNSQSQAVPVGRQHRFPRRSLNCTGCRCVISKCFPGAWWSRKGPGFMHEPERLGNLDGGR
jgi:hypothetical protein